jgi:hypothetical protein
MVLSGLKPIPERVWDRHEILAVKVMQVEDRGIVTGHVRQELQAAKTVVYFTSAWDTNQRGSTFE